jgi:hypothetical protein
MTVLISSIRASSGDPEHLKAFADAGARRPGSGRTMRHLFQGRASSASNKASGFEYRSRSDPRSKLKRPGNRPGRSISICRC